MRNLSVFLVMILLLSSYTIANQYYADIEITLDETGEVFIEGVTNHPNLQQGYHDELISKSKGHWLFELKTQDPFGDYIYHVSLPPGAQINYIKTTGSPRISDDIDHISLIDTGENKTIELKVQYSIQKQITSWISTRTIIEISIIITALLIFALYKWRKPKKALNMNHLPTRQKHILKLLKKNKGEMAQNELEKQLGWPKSSLSRNIDSLLKKHIIEKVQKGKINIIKIKDD